MTRIHTRRRRILIVQKFKMAAPKPEVVISLALKYLGMNPIPVFGMTRRMKSIPTA